VTSLPISPVIIVLLWFPSGTLDSGTAAPGNPVRIADVEKHAFRHDPRHLSWRKVYSE